MILRFESLSFLPQSVEFRIETFGMINFLHTLSSVNHGTFRISRITFSIDVREDFFIIK